VRRLRSVLRAFAKALVGLIVIILIAIGLGLTAIETGWAKNRIRELIVSQANQYLTATLAIGRLEGSLVRGIQLGDVRLSREGRTLIAIDEIALSYSIRELVDRGTVIRRVRLTRPRIVGAKQPDGRWDLGALIRAESREQERRGPNRPIEVQAIEVVDGDVQLRDPLDFGAAHVPTHFASLNAALSFRYYPVRWQLSFDRVSWIGSEPELTVTRLAGVFGRGPTGWFFNRLAVDTPRSAFTLDGVINTEVKPTQLDLHVGADRFAFQEWSGVLRGLKNIAVEASFETSLKGPTAQLSTELRLAGTGGAIAGRFTLDTSVPGWHGNGEVDVQRLNLARWINRPDRPSDITGHVVFNLDLQLGGHFPRGSYRFDGAHAMYMDYAADNVHARGQLTSTDALVSQATAVAYGARVTTADSSIGLDDPFPFRFRGTTTGIDLRRLPKPIPVPHVESLLTFDYDVTGQFANAYIAGNARFARSEFLGATIGAGTVGSVDTSRKPLHFTGDGDVDGLNPGRLGEGLEVKWLQDPRYAGTVSGHFRVDVSGTDSATLSLTGGGHLSRANLFHGELTDAEVSIDIAAGTLRASYNGRLTSIDPSIPFADARFESSLTGTGRVTATVRDLLVADKTTLDDYDIAGSMTVQPSTVRKIQIDGGRVEAALRASTLTVSALEVQGQAISGRASGSVSFADPPATDVSYEITELDLAALRPLTNRDASGMISTTGRVSGPSNALHAVGDANISQLDAFGVTALTFEGHYDATVPADVPSHASARITGNGTMLAAFGQPIREASGTVSLDDQRLGFDVQVTQAEGRTGALAGTVALHTDERRAEVEDLTVSLGKSPWRVNTSAARPTVSWTDDSVSVSAMELVGGSGDERLVIAGTWRPRGGGELRVNAQHVFLETLQGAFERPTRYGGVLDANMTIRGTSDLPLVTGTFSIVNGRVERVTYDKFAGRVDYSNRMFTVDVRLDQSAGVWLTATGTVPLGLFRRDLPEQPIDVALKSSAVNLGLIEGVTDVITKVSGTIQLDVRTIGTSRDPHFAGSVDIQNAAFLIAATGAAYRNVRGSFRLARDRITVETLHFDDVDGHSLDVRGSLGTHELQVGDVEIDATGRKFELMRNQLGRVEADLQLRIRGRFEKPRIAGDITIVSGSDVKVDEILERTLFQPYATEQAPLTQLDAVAALNPWDRLGLDISLHIPGTLRLSGANVQISPGTPIGLGEVSLRVFGDLYLYKDSEQLLYVTGALDSLTGTYAFQGRRFDVVPTSSVIFRGDLNPELYISVTRDISGVQARVSIIGPLQQPELHLSSTPPLDESDILSLIVFNTSTNQLSSAQQQELVVRAGALAAGFLATPIVQAIQTDLGLDILELEPAGDIGTGPRVTVGEEIAPGLVARFSRTFGQEPYDEATIEYYLSRLLRLRATFSDAQSLNTRSPFRRIERAGIDLLVFFSF